MKQVEAQKVIIEHYAPVIPPDGFDGVVTPENIRRAMELLERGDKLNDEIANS